MQCIAFHLGEQRYALALRDIVEVLPLLNLRVLPHAPAYVSGVLNYRGQIVPVIDLCQLTIQQPCQQRMSSRLLMVRVQLAKGVPRLVGLLVERAVSTLTLDPQQLNDMPVRLANSPYLDRLCSGSPDMLQLIQLSHLLGAEVLDSLYHEANELS